jgi:hypothetical protein
MIRTLRLSMLAGLPSKTGCQMPLSMVGRQKSDGVRKTTGLEERR